MNDHDSWFPDALSLLPLPRVEAAADEVVLSAAGALDGDSADELARRVQAEADGGARWLVLEMSGVRFVDSYGLAALLRVRHTLVNAGGGLVLAAPAPSVTRMLEITRMQHVFPVAPALPAAVDHLRRSRGAGLPAGPCADRHPDGGC
ncbi:STAS domain-containing protein [Streptacidiphilus sp. ASG 303]|uniref:STAS domain-containing protein n=1 Tax=Streptacidiphilus sp. ASG 303 TaxID=2896847 RepID=UPI001E2CDD2B|nr:STAS domain-containing protein [Streptacidiphilus sp. ASG 303]MCD0480900.1 STAS domain-containing protein [Streptacidiphilus sp. ASG 303]